MSHTVADDCIAGDACPTPTTHKRLEAFHRAWHRCLDAYADPDEFAIEINNALQAARNVTFALQKEMKHTSGFTEWYGTWQSVLRNDPVSRWSVEARNRVVKAGDLETRSTTRAWEFDSYLAATAFVAHDFARDGTHINPTIPVQTLDSLKTIADRIVMTEELRRANSAVAVERRWEDVELPGWELLDALGHCFGLLACLTADADVQFSQRRVRPNEDWYAPDRIGTEGWPMPEGAKPSCMVTSQNQRTTILRLTEEDDPVGRGRTVPVAFDPDWAIRALERYGPIAEPPVDARSVLDFVDTRVEMARVILQKDRDHAWTMSYYRDANLVHTEYLVARDRADKYQIALHVAEVARRLRANGVLEAGEVWMATASRKDPNLPSDLSVVPGRQEGVMVSASTASGEHRSVIVNFRRSAFGIVTLGESVEMPTHVANSLLPLLESWKREPHLYGVTARPERHWTPGDR